MGYIAKSAYYQADLLRRRVPIASAASMYPLTPEQQQQIQLTMKVREFMAKDLNLTVDKNYATYVHLDRDHVTYAVSAAPKDKLEHHTWSFPIIGSVPYKGYFNKEDAMEEAKRLEAEDLDVFVRGITAYSTLGWFSDPLLYSMLGYRPHQLVDTLIHETVHANLYINSESSFNERVASYLGLLGAEAYYKKQKGGEDVNRLMAQERADSKVFSTFITKEIESLRKWYDNNAGDPKLLEKREQKFKALQERFQSQVVPQLQTENFKYFGDLKLNNARLLLYDLYMSEFSDFENVARARGRDFKSMFKYLKSLEDVDNPVEQLKKDGSGEAGASSETSP